MSLWSIVVFICLSHVHLGKPEEVLHEGAGVRIFNLHNRNLVLGSHQNIVISVEYGCQIETSGKTNRKRAWVKI